MRPFCFATVYTSRMKLRYFFLLAFFILLIVAGWAVVSSMSLPDAGITAGFLVSGWSRLGGRASFSVRREALKVIYTFIMAATFFGPERIFGLKVQEERK